MIQHLLKIPESPAKDEIFETLIQSAQIRIERIISKGHHSDPDFWYDQDEHEWVIILQGQAVLELKNPDNNIKQVRMKVGDAINLPAHQPHRVKSTSNTEPTIWLAVFYK